MPRKMARSGLKAIWEARYAGSHRHHLLGLTSNPENRYNSTRLGVIGGITVLMVGGGCWRLQFFCSIDRYSESQT